MKKCVKLIIAALLSVAWQSAAAQGFYVNSHDGSSKYYSIDEVQEIEITSPYAEEARDDFWGCLTFYSPEALNFTCHKQSKKIYCTAFDGYDNNGNGGYTFRYRLEKDGDWIWLDIDGRYLTISLTRNDTGKMRIGSISMVESGKSYVYAKLIIKQAPVPESSEPIELDGHECVDLGLPSGMLWATCNVGASEYYGKGDVFAVGEVETRDRSTYGWDQYMIDSNGLRLGQEGYQDPMADYNKGGQYYKARRFPGVPDGFAESEFDVARQKWGGRWRMPTAAETTELESYCAWEETSKNGVMGYEMTSVVNGNSIFLPYGGFCDNTPYYGDPNKDNFGLYWTSSTWVNSDMSDNPWGLAFQLGRWITDETSNDWHGKPSISTNYDNRHIGGTVRPVIRPDSVIDEPEENPGDEPEENPGDDPEDNPGDNPEENPGDDPEENPGDGPEENPGDDPVDEPIEDGRIYAILYHGESQSIYYDETALQQAYQYAVDGDHIKLSSGIFHAVDIDKQISIAGSGCYNADEESRTQISGDFQLGCTDDAPDNMSFSMKGVYHGGNLKYGFKLAEVRMYDVRLNLVEPQNYDFTTNFEIIKSKVQERFSLNHSSKARFLNSFIYDPQTEGKGAYDFDHCVIFNLNNVINNSSYLNTIIDCCLTVALDSSNSVSHCLSVGGNCEACFNDVNAVESQVVPGHGIFKTFVAWGFTEEEDYQFTDEAAPLYIGSDGTQIGMNGGLYPFISKREAPW